MLQKNRGGCMEENYDDWTTEELIAECKRRGLL